jgi:hypothetical protein
LRHTVAARRDGRTARWLRINESSGRSSIRGRSLADFRDCGDCGGCRIEDRGVGVVEGIEQTFALRNRLLDLELRSCRGKKTLVITKYYDV